MCLCSHLCLGPSTPLAPAPVPHSSLVLFPPYFHIAPAPAIGLGQLLVCLYIEYKSLLNTIDIRSPLLTLITAPHFSLRFVSSLSLLLSQSLSRSVCLRSLFQQFSSFPWWWISSAFEIGTPNVLTTFSLASQMLYNLSRGAGAG